MNDYTGEFERFWLSGMWIKTGKKNARRHFRASVKSDDDWQAIQTARDRYELHLLKNKWKTAQLGGTWFNNWLDWVEFVEAPRPRESTLLGIDLPGYYDGLKALR